MHSADTFPPTDFASSPSRNRLLAHYLIWSAHYLSWINRVTMLGRGIIGSVWWCRSSPQRPIGAITPVLDADYWVGNVREPVKLREAIVTAGTEHCTFIEISPHPILTQAITETLGDVRGKAVRLSNQVGVHDRGPNCVPDIATTI